jgi:hypothetical protein
MIVIPRRSRRARRHGSIALLGLLAAACGDRSPEQAQLATVPGDTAAGDPRYTREYTFLGRNQGTPIAATLAFTASPRGTHLQRTARGWLARGEEWDRFLDARWATSGVGGVWRIVPHEALVVIADGPDEVDALVFRRGDRTLRLYPGQGVSTWDRREGHRVTVRRGILEIAHRPLEGYVVESLILDQPGSQAHSPGTTYDRAILTDGDQLLFVLGDGSHDDGAKRLGWGIAAGMEHRWQEVDLRWLHVRPEAQARRDVPLQWSVRIEEADIDGEIVSLTHDLQLGPESGGRRPVEMQHMVEGWLTVDGEQVHVFGTLRHVQR